MKTSPQPPPYNSIRQVIADPDNLRFRVWVLALLLRKLQKNKKQSWDDSSGNQDASRTLSDAKLAIHVKALNHAATLLSRGSRLPGGESQVVAVFGTELDEGNSLTVTVVAGR